MNIDKIKKLVLICFLLFPRLALAADMVKGDYTGWKFSEALSDLARKGGLNIVSDSVDKKVKSFRLNSEVYIEEALNHLVIANDCHLRKIGEIWLVSPAEIDHSSDFNLVVKDFSWRQAAPSLSIFKPLLESGIWFPPGSGKAVLYGKKDKIDEIKKIIETVDTPLWTLQLDYSLLHDDGSILASCSFLTLNNHSFKLMLSEPEVKMLAGIDGEAKVNDDGIISLKQKQLLQIDGQSLNCSETLVFKDGESCSKKILIGDKSYRQSWKCKIKSNLGRIMALNPDRPGLTLLPKANRRPVEEAFDPTCTIISGPKSPRLEKPLLINDLDLAVALEKMAAADKISLICDENVKGKVSAWCYADRLDKEDLIKAMVKLKKLGIKKTALGYLVSSPQNIAGMDLSEQSELIVPPLKKISSESAADELKNFLQRAGISARISLDKEKRLHLRAAEKILPALKILLDEWAKPHSQYSVGALLDWSGQKFKENALLVNDKPMQKAWNKNAGQLHLRLVAKPYHDGLRELEYNIASTGSGNSRFVIHASLFLANRTPFTVVRSQGRIRFEAKISGKVLSATSDPVEPEEEDPYF